MTDYIRTSEFLPPTAVLELTYNCNHKCLFCSCPWEAPNSVYPKESELNITQWKECIDKLIKYGVRSFSFTGGEPLLKEGLKDIIRHIGSKKVLALDKELQTSEITPDMFLISNGQLINEDWLYFLKEYNVNLSMSLPGLRTYNYHTQSGICDKILSNFDKAVQIGLRTTVNITVTKKNLFELEETISNALIAGAGNLLLNRFLPGGRGMFYIDDLLLSKEETIKMLGIAEKVLVKANRYGNVGTEMPMCILTGMEFKNLSVGTRCAAATGFVVLGPEGKARTCNHSPLKLVHYSEIEKLKINNYWQKFTQKDFLPEDCEDCKLNYACDGGCREAAHIFRGCVNGLDPIF